MTDAMISLKGLIEKTPDADSPLSRGQASCGR
jgi:hypothetical protein